MLGHSSLEGTPIAGSRRGPASRTRRPAPPPARVRSEPRPRPRPQAAGPILRNLLVLVVEDHADTRELLRRMLEPLGARVFLAEDARTALRVLEVDRPDIILLDLMLPGMDGLTFAHHVHQDPRLASIPILAVTALATMADYIQTWSRGFAGHLTKPVDQADLAASIRRAIRGSRRDRR
jgi:CheY-like chemotaxis protein